MDSPIDVVIRNAAAEDLPVVEQLISPFVERRQLLARSTTELAELLPTGFVAEIESEIVGFSSVEIYSSKLAEILCLAVHDSYRGHGIGKLLVTECVELAKRQGVMEVMAISNAEEFLKNCGFDFTLPDQKKALFCQLRPRFE